ncbi:MAG: hypothetical protein HUU46_01615 [Candidatus Hydrogenedentes bacterium]|nr:hypothetical protein [Candidatus Hydrogenedentota bacterium]
MKVSTTKVLGVTEIAVGAIWVWKALIQPMFKSIVEGNLGIFDFTMLPFLSSPGFFAICVGYGLFRHADLNSVTRSIGILFVFAALFIAVSVGAWFQQPSEIASATIVVLTISVFVMLPIYVWLSKRVLKNLGIVTEGLHNFFGKPSAFLLALLVWSFSREVVEFLIPDRTVSGDFNWWHGAAVIAAIFLAFMFYDVFLKVVGIENRLPKHFNGQTHA